MFAYKGLLQNCMGLMFANKTPRQRRRSTSPRRDPKRRCRRSVCDKRDTQSRTADKHSLANSGKGRASERCSYYFAHKGAFDANAPTTVTTMSGNVFISVFAYKGRMQNCIRLMFANNGLLQNCMGLMFAVRGRMQNCMGLMFAIDGRMQNCIGLMFANNGLLQNCIGLMFVIKGLLQTA
jgi:hypothetical protein